MRDTVGVLLDRETFIGIPRRRTGNERIALYDKAAEQVGLKPFYMSLHQTGKRTALGFTYRGRAYRLERRPIPKVTHNRTISLTPFLKLKLKQLAQSSILFNRENRYDKHRIYKLLSRKNSLREYLPISTRYSREQLKTAMRMYTSLYIKPTNSSVGDGIIKISKGKNGDWKIYWKSGTLKHVSSRQAISFIEKKVAKQKYMIQEAIPLAVYKGSPYDLRVSVQRGDNGNWQITGIVGKVAASGRHVTNVAKGGKVKRCEELFMSSGFDSDRIKEAIHAVSLDIAKYLSNKLPHLADIGLDIGVDQAGKIKFIEMNGRDQRYTFRKAKMSTTFYKTYKTPMQYAKYLLKQYTND